MSDELVLKAMKAEAQDGTTRLRIRLSQLGAAASQSVPRFGTAFANDLYDLICKHGGWAPKAEHPWAKKGGAKSSKAGQ